jgi:hypothetical protein
MGIFTRRVLTSLIEAKKIEVDLVRGGYALGPCLKLAYRVQMSDAQPHMQESDAVIIPFIRLKFNANSKKRGHQGFFMTELIDQQYHFEANNAPFQILKPATSNSRNASKGTLKPFSAEEPFADEIVLAINPLAKLFSDRMEQRQKESAWLGYDAAVYTSSDDIEIEIEAEIAMTYAYLQEVETPKFKVVV